MRLTKKYRPQSLDEVVGQEEVIKALKNLIANDRRVHLLFLGPTGIGKTTIAKSYTREIYGDKWKGYWREFNASGYERGIDTIRGPIKRMCQQKKGRVLFLDEADHLCLPTGTEVVVGFKDQKTDFRTREIQEISDKRYYQTLPSVNLDTGEIEKDKAKMVDSGTAPFYKVTLEDGRSVTASPNHPFFFLEGGKLNRVKLKELNVGDRIVDYSDHSTIFNYCEICGKPTLNQRFCSMECKDTGHSKDMTGSGNPMHGREAWNKGLTAEEDERVASQGHPGKENPNYGGEWHGELWHNKSEEERKKVIQKISESRKNKSYEEIYGSKERALEERAKRHPNATIESVQEPSYREKVIGDKDSIKCSICGRKVKVGGRDGIYVHHIDGDKSNNDVDNLMSLCPRCHNLEVHDRNEDFLKRGWKITHSTKSWEEKFGEKTAKEMKRKRRIDPVAIKDIEFVGKKKAWNLSIKKNKSFILANGIVTHNTSDAQHALRRTMEKTDTAQLILSANYGHEIIKPIRGRCTNFIFRKLEDEEVLRRLASICKKEGITLDKKAKEGLKRLTREANGNLRWAINQLEKTITGEGKIDPSVIRKYREVSEIRACVEQTLDGNFEKAKNKLEDEVISRRFGYRSILRELHAYLDNADEEDIDRDVKIRLYQKLAQVEDRLLHGGNPLIQLTGFLAYCWVVKSIPNRCDQLPEGEV